MKYIAPLLLLAAFGLALPAAAQISIDEVNAEEEEVTFRDELKPTSVDLTYFNRARYRAERAAIRKERNYLEIGSSSRVRSPPTTTRGLPSRAVTTPSR